MALIVNLFGVPGAGKSTGAAYIFSQLKMRGVNTELVTEFAKDKVWEENKEVFNNQAYIFGKQSFKISRCANKVDIVITDSPLPLSIFYNNDPLLTENFNNSVMDVFNGYDNMNYLLMRVKPYNHTGRHQSEEESDAMKEPLIKLLEDREICYKKIDGDIKGYNTIVDDIIHRLNLSPTSRAFINLIERIRAMNGNIYDIIDEFPKDNITEQIKKVQEAWDSGQLIDKTNRNEKWKLY